MRSFTTTERAVTEWVLEQLALAPVLDPERARVISSLLFDSRDSARRWVAAGRLDAHSVGPELRRTDLARDDRLARRIPTRPSS